MKKPKIETINAHETLKIGLTAVATGIIWFYAGPVASVAATQLFNVGYDLLYGIPNWYHPSYLVGYMPLREHVSHYAFEYGGLMLGSLCAPIIYKGVGVVSDAGGKALTHLGIGVENKQKTLLPLLHYSKKKKSKAPLLMLADMPHTSEQDFIKALKTEKKKKRESAPITSRF